MLDHDIKKKPFAKKQLSIGEYIREKEKTFNSDFTEDTVEKRRKLHNKLSNALDKETRFNNLEKPSQFFDFGSLQICLPSPGKIKFWTIKKFLSDDASNADIVKEILEQKMTSSKEDKFTIRKFWHQDPMTRKGKQLAKKSIEQRVHWLKKTIQSKQIQNSRTLDYKNLKPESGGLFCENIFGEESQFERRRHQLGYIDLVTPVMHIWHLKAAPSPIAVLLDQNKSKLEKLTYHLGRISAPSRTSKADYTATNFRSLILHRHKNLHFSDHLETIWLTQSCSLKSLTYSVFDNYIKNTPILQLGLSEPNIPSFAISRFSPFYSALSEVNDRQKKNYNRFHFILSHFQLLNEEVETKIFNVYQLPSRSLAWQKPSTNKTVGGTPSPDFMIFHNLWGSFLTFGSNRSIGKRALKKPNSSFLPISTIATWQQDQSLQNQEALTRIRDHFFWNLPLLSNRSHSNLTLLVFMFQHSLVFNTINTVLDITLKNTVTVLESCPQKFNPLVQKEVYSNYSPILKEFFNQLWRQEEMQKTTLSRGTINKKDQGVGHLSLPTKGKNKKEKKVPVPIKQIKTWFPTKPTEFTPLFLSYEKKVMVSTFKQGMDDNPTFQLYHDKDFFTTLQFVIQNQLLFWIFSNENYYQFRTFFYSDAFIPFVLNANHPGLNTKSFFEKINQGVLSKEKENQGKKNKENENDSERVDSFLKLDSQRSFLLNIMKLNNRYLTKKQIPTGFRHIQSSFFHMYHSNDLQTLLNYPSQTYTFYPVSLHTNILELDKKNQIKKRFLLPFVDPNGEIVKKSVNRHWYRKKKKIQLNCFFQNKDKNRPHPLGHKKFRNFLQKGFSLSLTKNLFISLMKISKISLLNDGLKAMEHFGNNETENQGCFSLSMNQTPIDLGSLTNHKKKGHWIDQLDYEKHKCIHFFFNFLILTCSYTLTSFLDGRPSENKKPFPFTPSSIATAAKKKRFQERQETNRLSLHASSESGAKEPTSEFEWVTKTNAKKINSFDHYFALFFSNQQTRMKSVSPFPKPAFFFLSQFFEKTKTQPFCYFPLNSSFKKKLVFDKLNPFLIQNQCFAVRYLTKSNGFQFNIRSDYTFFPNIYGANWSLLRLWSEIKKRKPKKKIKVNFTQRSIVQDEELLVSERGQKFENFLSKESSFCRNPYAVVPSFFFWEADQSHSEWSLFLYYMTSSRNIKDQLIPSYAEKGMDINHIATGAQMIETALKNLTEVQMNLLKSIQETQSNHVRMQWNEPFLFSDDSYHFFHDRLWIGPERNQKPIFYHVSKGVGTSVLINFMKKEIERLDPIIYRCEKGLAGKNIYQGEAIFKNIYNSEWPLEEREGAPPLTLQKQDCKMAKQNYKYPYYYEDMYLQLVKTRIDRFKMIRRLKMLYPFLIRPYIFPEWMILRTIPVLPPDLRPILILENEQMIISDLNKFYQQIINRNKRVYSSSRYDLTAMTLGQYSERLLQEAVDELIDYSKSKGSTMSTEQPLKSLSDMLKGKQGRFRQNLLGKRVDYSGRSVIIVGPQLKVYECGLPKEMAIELFKPFLIRYLIETKHAVHFLSAKRLIQTKKPIIWSSLRKVMADRPVLLNRAPTLHRLGIQAFQPRLVSGRAILLHPLVCSAYNADFDGDQMGVHIPLSNNACAEAWKLMWSRNNILSPSTGDPILMPSQDMILGCYYLTTLDKMRRMKELVHDSKLYHFESRSSVEDCSFDCIDQILHFVHLQKLQYHSTVWLRWDHHFELEREKQPCVEIQIDQDGNIIKIYPDYKMYLTPSQQAVYFIKTTPGRVLLNQSIFTGLKFKNTF